MIVFIVELLSKKIPQMLTYMIVFIVEFYKKRYYFYDF